MDGYYLYTILYTIDFIRFKLYLTLVDAHTQIKLYGP